MLKSWLKQTGISALVVSLVASTFVISAPEKAEAAASEAYNWNSVATGAGGGYVPGIIFNKKEKDLIYARTDVGGAYRWNKTTSSWDQLLDSVGWVDWNKYGVDALATDPVDPNRLYLATGMYTNDWDGSNGSILRSTDKGDTWSVTTLPFKVGGNMPGRGMGERLAIDPNKNSILFFGARSGNGLWKSTDYGATWSKVTSFPNVGTYIQTPGDAYAGDIVGLSWITFDPATGTSGNATQTIYAGVADKGTSVYKSTDGGATWTAVAGQPTGYIPHHGELSSNGNLYITYSDGAGPYDGAKGDIWKLNTSTGAWTNISPVPSSSTDNYFGYGGISVDAQNPNTLIVAALNMWWPDVQIYRSTDGGATWKTFWTWGSYPNRILNYTHDITAAPWLDMGVTATMPDVSPKLGWMIDDIEIDPFNSDRMMYGTGATIYGTANLTALDSGGKVNLSVMAKGIEETAVLGLISPPSGAPLVSALGDIAGFRHDSLTTPPSKVFTNPHWATTYGIDYAELTPSYIVRVGMADYDADSTAKSVAISTDGGTNWYKANAEPSGTAGGGTVAVAADGSSIVWSTSDVGVYYSKSGGNSWTASTGIPANAKIASDRVNKNKFYAFSAGKMYVSTDGGATFAVTVSSGLPTWGSADIKAVPGVEGDVWFAGGNSNVGEGPYGLWHSTNSGASFTKLSNVEEADAIGFGKAATGQTYMALYTAAKIDGVRGIFRSIDGGTTWVRINDDKHQYGRAQVITGDPRVYGRVYLGTNGRGILYAEPAGTTTVNNSTITPTTASFDKKTANQADISVTMTLNGNTLSSIKNGSATLVSGTDYTVSGTTITILKSYLAAQAVGTTTLTFNFSAGAAASIAVSVVDTTSSASNSTITPTTASFDKKTANQADIAVTMTLNGNTLSSITNGSTTLVSGTNYTVSGTTVTILKSYLAAQAVGTTTLTFNFSAGAAASIAISVVDTTSAATGAIKVQMFNGTTSASTVSVNPRIRIVNTGTTAINLSDVKVRYYYTANGTQAQAYAIDWASVGNANVTGSFVTMAAAKTNADTYLEIGFSSAAGTLAAGASADIQVRFNKTDWSNYTQTDDYSFNSTATAYTDSTKTTGYLAGTLQWGIEP